MTATALCVDIEAPKDNCVTVWIQDAMSKLYQEVLSTYFLADIQPCRLIHLRILKLTVKELSLRRDCRSVKLRLNFEVLVPFYHIHHTTAGLYHCLDRQVTTSLRRNTDIWCRAFYVSNYGRVDERFCNIRCDLARGGYIGLIQNYLD